MSAAQQIPGEPQQTLTGVEQFQGMSAPGLAPTTAAGGQHAYFSVWDIHAYYGESYIVQGVSFDIREGEIVALLGRNGAGKTSTLRAIARVDNPALRHGEIWLDHKPLHNMKAYEASRNGIGLVPEDRRIIQGLTVEENLQLAQIAPPIGWSIERIYELFPRLGERRKQEGTTLSGGEQQMLAIGRTLARDVKLLLLDEPYEGLAPTRARRATAQHSSLARRFSTGAATRGMGSHSPALPSVHFPRRRSVGSRASARVFVRRLRSRW
jgi:branched-chain amino acid transport system ATP-binding protein